MAKYVKSKSGYEKSFEADWKAVKSGLKKARAEQGEPKKVPTSVALDPRFVTALKKEAASRGVPYQILMRVVCMMRQFPDFTCYRLSDGRLS